MNIIHAAAIRVTMAGGVAGLIFSLAALAPFSHFSGPTFHAGGAALRFVAFSLAAGTLGGCAAAARKKSVRAAVVYGIAAVVVGGGLAFGFGWDPARHLDEQGLMSEYRTLFPYGRPDLARDQDILVIEELVNRYSRTRAEGRTVKADLDWLKDKRRDDARRIADMEKTLTRIETIRDKGLESKVSPRSGSGSRFRLPRKQKTPIIIW